MEIKVCNKGSLPYHSDNAKRQIDVTGGQVTKGVL